MIYQIHRRELFKPHIHATTVGMCLHKCEGTMFFSSAGVEKRFRNTNLTYLAILCQDARMTWNYILYSYKSMNRGKSKD